MCNFKNLLGFKIFKVLFKNFLFSICWCFFLFYGIGKCIKIFLYLWFGMFFKIKWLLFCKMCRFFKFNNLICFNVCVIDGVWIFIFKYVLVGLFLVNFIKCFVFLKLIFIKIGVWFFWIKSLKVFKLRVFFLFVCLEFFCKLCEMILKDCE